MGAEIVKQLVREQISANMFVFIYSKEISFYLF